MTRMAIAVVAGLLGAAGIAYAVGEGRQTRVLQEIRQLTGARTRVVWCQQAAGDGRDVGAVGTQLLLMGLDTAEPEDPRPLLRNVGNYHKPLISPKGDRVVFTDFPRATICVVNWSGTSLRELARGFALEVWMDPATQQEWVYALDTLALDEGIGKPVIRFKLDNPFKRERVWDATPVAQDNFQVSTDGTKAGALFPWPLAGVADLSAGTWREGGRGCWTGLSPDNNYLLWVFDGAHRNLMFHTPDGRENWKVCINQAPGVEGYEVYHPRWSNRLRFMAMTGPYKGGEGPNQIRAGGNAVEVYIGRFATDLTNVEQWVQVTHNRFGDFYPDVWVEPAAGAAAQVPEPADRRSRSGAPMTPQRLVVQARLIETSATPTLAAIAPYRQALVVYAYQVENVVAGEYRHPTLLVAHWGLVQGKAVAIPKTKGTSYRLTVEPFDAHPELEGERVIMDGRGDNLPIYYEINL